MAISESCSGIIGHTTSMSYRICLIVQGLFFIVWYVCCDGPWLLAINDYYDLICFFSFISQKSILLKITDCARTGFCITLAIFYAIHNQGRFFKIPITYLVYTNKSWPFWSYSLWIRCKWKSFCHSKTKHMQDALTFVKIICLAHTNVPCHGLLGYTTLIVYYI